MLYWNNSTKDATKQRRCQNLKMIVWWRRRKLIYLHNSCKCKKNQLIDLQKHFERYCNVLPVFGFNSAKYDINLVMSYLLPILVNYRDIEPTVMKKANQFVCFKFGDIQLLDFMNFLGRATRLDSFLKAYNTQETKGFFPYEWFDFPEKMNNKELPPYDSFFSVLRNSSPLEKDYNDFQNLVNSGLTT